MTYAHLPMWRSAAATDNVCMKRTAALLLVSLLTAMLPAPALSATNGSTCWSSKRPERSLTKKMNLARDAAGVRPMRLDPELSKVARVHTSEMVRANELYHTPAKALIRRVTNWVTLGENVGVGGTVAAVHGAFMASPLHRDNILSSAYNHVGVGTKKADGRLWVTIVFEARTDPGTTLPMPSC